MLTVPSNARLFLYQQPMSIRKSFEGLSSAIAHLFPGELLSGAFFIFLNKKKDHLKLLFGAGKQRSSISMRSLGRKMGMIWRSILKRLVNKRHGGKLLMQGIE